MVAQSALFGSAGVDPEASALYQTAAAQLAEARSRHGFLPQHEILAEVILNLARSASSGGKGYAQAQLAKELRECLAALPGDQASDPMDQLTRHLDRVNLARTGDGRSEAVPTYATAPVPGADHDLAAIGEVAAMLGTPLMPWQAAVARVATERLEDGRWRYPVVVVTVPRQSGKTTLMRAVLAQRAIMRPSLLAFYTAQTGKDARARWLDLVSAVDDSPLMGGLTTVRKAAGDSGLLWPNGSRISPFAPTPKSLHGYTPPLVMTDEAFAFDAAAGNALEGAIRPAQITLKDRQWWIVSTAGTSESTWLRRWVDLGRQTVRDGNQGAGICYVEYSCPDDADVYDPAAWARFHPALGLTVDQAALAADAESTTRGEWERAYGNRWTSSQQTIIPLDRWDDLATPSPTVPDGVAIGLAYDVAEDRSEAAIWAAYLVDGVATLRTVRADRGIDWLADAVRDAQTALGGPERVVLVAPEDGPSRQVTDELRRDLVDVLGIPTRDYATACGALLWRAENGLLAHDGSPALRASVTVAQTRPTSDGAYAWSRRGSAGSIAALVAATLAVRAAEHTRPGEAPVIRFPEDAAALGGDDW